jgi:hypothetical protein
MAVFGCGIDEGKVSVLSLFMKERSYHEKGAVAMRRVAVAVLLLSLEISGRASASNGGQVSPVRGVAVSSQSGSDVTNAAFCPNGNARQGSCGSGAPAGITYATMALNWTQTISSSLTSGSQATVTLTPCPVGIDTTSGAGYQVLLSGGGNSESVNIIATSGGCTSGAASGTITFTPFYSYSAGYTISSASSGIQETINAACGTSSNPNLNAQCNVTIPANGPYTGGPGQSLNNYNVAGTIFFHSNQSALNGDGTSLNCTGRGPCLQMGDRANSNDYSSNAVKGLSFRSPTNFSSNPAYAGVHVTNTTVTGGYATITTSAAHNFRPGDLVTILFTDDRSYWGDAAVTDCGSGTTPAACTGGSTTFRYARSGTIALQNTPGIVALAYEAILDNANDSHFTGIQYDFGGEVGRFNNFFDMWDDENATIDHFNSTAGLNGSATWIGSYVFSGGAENIGHQLAPVITLRDSNITSSQAGVTVYNSNGLYIENTVIQGTSMWQVYSSNSTGNYQGAYLKNIYSESTTAQNPLTPPRSPFPGLGIAGLIAGDSTGAARFQIVGSQGTLGAFASGGTGSKPYSYFIVANDTTAGTQTSPMQVVNWLSTGRDSIPVRWPRVANGSDAITYDVIRITTPVGVGAIYPYTGGCLGGPGGTCGYVAQGLSQAMACSGGLVCIYTDSGSASTVGHGGTAANYPLEGTYSGHLIFWPGSLVTVNTPVTTDFEQSPLVSVGLGVNPAEIATFCSGNGVASAGGYTSCLVSSTPFNNSITNQAGTLISDGGNNSFAYALSKGRLNFSQSPFYPFIAPHHIITLIDSQPALTRGTSGYRPPASASDTWIGTDAPTSTALASGQLAFGAPVSITNYIRATGDGVHSNWLERLTSERKTFAVPVKINEGNSLTLGDGSPLARMKIYSVNKIPASRVPPQRCVDVVGEATGLTKLDQIAGITPPRRLGNLSLNAYPADEGAIVLHFCNPSTSEATTPSGAYSFLAVR